MEQIMKWGFDLLDFNEEDTFLDEEAIFVTTFGELSLFLKYLALSCSSIFLDFVRSIDFRFNTSCPGVS